MRLNLQTKLLSSIAIIVVVVLVVLIFYTTTREREVFQRAFRARGIISAQTLEAGIGSREELKDVKKLQSSIYKLMWLDPEIAKISISVSTPEGLQIIASNDTGAIGTLSDYENELVFEQDVVRTRTLYQPDTPPMLSVITPVHVGGQRLGTYDIRLSLEAEEAAIRKQQKELILCLVATLVFITLSLSLTLKRMVISPIVAIQKGLEKIRTGNLDWRITPKSKDELGDLARGFNETAKELKESHVVLEEKVEKRTEELESAKKELEEAKSILEVRVQARTKELESLTENLEMEVKERTRELRERLEELEKFRKSTVGREMKMIELKDEIRRLKEELGK